MNLHFCRNAMKSKEPTSTLDSTPIRNYMHYIVLPLKFVGCWDWYKFSERNMHILHIMINNLYLCMVLFIMTNVSITLIVHMIISWTGIMNSLDVLAESLPCTVSLMIIVYLAMHREDLYKLLDYMKENFKYRSANGLTNMTMLKSYKTAKAFGYFYTSCTLFSVIMYTVPEIISWITNQPHVNPLYMDLTRNPFIFIAFLRQFLTQVFIGLAMGQFGVFYAANSILLCGQLDLLCCSLRNARYTALLRAGVQHRALARAHADIQQDELHNYIYNVAEMQPSGYHYDEKMSHHFTDKRTKFDIYSPEFDEGTCEALRDCARLSNIINRYKEAFERFVSPVLAIRVVQVTLYICMLLYAATLKFDMVTVEYLGAVSLDTFVYCFFGNQIIIQADRVSTAAYQSAWHTMGLRPRRLLLNILLANRNPVVVRAGLFLPLNLQTFVSIIKTSFSYYTLLVNVNEKE